MIVLNDLLELVSNTDPRFAAAAGDFVEDWKNEPETEKEGLPHYLLFSELAGIVAQGLKKGDHENFNAIFDLIEQLHIEGDQKVKELATVGFLEDIQNIMLADKTGLHLAHPFLLPQSKIWWDKLILFWEHDDKAALHE